MSQRYELLENISKGSLGVSYKTYDHLLNRFVILRSHLVQKEQENTVIEQARMMAKFSHPNILRVYDYVEIDGTNYVVMPHIEGETLGIIIRTRKLATLSLLNIFRGIANALDYLHSKGNVYENLKPSNILIDESLQPYLTDFTLSTLRNRETEQEHGSPKYVSPEFLKKQPITNKVDIYSLGIIIFECLTLSHPFGDISNIPMLDLLKLHLSTERSFSVQKYRPELPIGIDLIVKRCMTVDPETRYDAASDAVDELFSVFYSGKTNIEGKIFISYARKDSEYVHQLAKELRRIGLDIWIDQDIEPGSNWDEAIENALNDCDMMLLITTEASMSSEYVTHEWSYFMGGGKPVYPFIPQAPIPDNIHPRLSRVQHVVGTDDMLNNVARIVDVLAGGTPTRINGEQ